MAESNIVEESTEDNQVFINIPTAEDIVFCRKEIGVFPELKSYPILLRGIRYPERSKGGLYQPESARIEKTTDKAIGLVVAIGPISFLGGHREYYRVNVGDWITYSKSERDPLWFDLDGEKVFGCYIADDKVRSRILEEDLPKYLDGGF
jgi:co-chaperonin GroES (HSP10)